LLVVHCLGSSGEHYHTQMCTYLGSVSDAWGGSKICFESGGRCGGILCAAVAFSSAGVSGYTARGAGSTSGP
jgi:hypothetical protein